MPLRIFKPRYRCCSLLAVEHWLAEPRLDEHLELEQLYACNTATMKTELKSYGPMEVGLLSTNDLYASVAD